MIMMSMKFKIDLIRPSRDQLNKAIGDIEKAKKGILSDILDVESK